MDPHFHCKRTIPRLAVDLPGILDRCSSASHSSVVAHAGKQYVVFRTATGIVLRVYEMQPVPGRPPSVFTLHELKRWPKKLNTLT